MLQIVYQPHVAHRDGNWLTPDLALETVGIVRSGLDPVPVSVERWTSRVAVAEPAKGVRILPAVALVAASRGELLAPAMLHVEGARLSQEPVATLTNATVVVGRSAWRVCEVFEDPASVLMTWSAGPQPDTLAPFQSESLAGAAEVHDLLYRLGEGKRMRKGVGAVLLLDPGHEEPPSASGWLRVEFVAPDLPTIVHEYGRLPLPSTSEILAP